MIACVCVYVCVCANSEVVQPRCRLEDLHPISLFGIHRTPSTSHMVHITLCAPSSSPPHIHSGGSVLHVRPRYHADRFREGLSIKQRQEGEWFELKEPCLNADLIFAPDFRYCICGVKIKKNKGPSVLVGRTREGKAKKRRESLSLS